MAKVNNIMNIFFSFFSYIFILYMRAQVSVAQHEQRSLLVGPNERQYYRLPLGLNATGPESIAFDCEGGGPYVGVSDGRILKWQGNSTGFTVFAITNASRPTSCDGVNSSPREEICGRPLGLKFNMQTCELYVADATFGLVKVNRSGGVATLLANSAEGVRFRFTNAIDIDNHTNDVYFTDSSSIFPRRHFLLITPLDKTGRLMKYSPDTGVVTVLLKGLTFANGVALSKNKDYLLVAETTLLRVLKYWLKGPKAGPSEVFIDGIHLNGLPDNIHTNVDGSFWIANNPAIPTKVSESKMVLERLNSIEVINSSDVLEFNNTLWFGSIDRTYVVYSR